jgi:hypothetical protein
LETEIVRGPAVAADGRRTELELQVRRAAKRMVRRGQEFAARHYPTIMAQDPDSMKAFTEAMTDEHEHRYFERLKRRLEAVAQKMGPENHVRDSERLAEEFADYHETMDLAQALSDAISEDVVLRHLRGDCERKEHSEPETLSGLTRIGYDMVYMANLEHAKELSKKEEKSILDVIEENIALNRDLIAEIRNFMAYGDAFDDMNVMFGSAPERRPLKKE